MYNHCSRYKYLLFVTQSYGRVISGAVRPRFSEQLRIPPFEHLDIRFWLVSIFFPISHPTSTRWKMIPDQVPRQCVSVTLELGLRLIFHHGLKPARWCIWETLIELSVLVLITICVYRRLETFIIQLDFNFTITSASTYILITHRNLHCTQITS